MVTPIALDTAHHLRVGQRQADGVMVFIMDLQNHEFTSNTTGKISVQAVSKMYRMYQKPSDRLIEFVTRRPKHEERVVLDDVSFEVPKGEVLGLIGQNGAGKSTLLKIIAARLAPTTGSATIVGSMVAILELGTGFHPDFSGRENVVLGGLCLGLSRQVIESKIEEIIAFSELEDVIDYPFRTYSSGMKARLTFATAVSVDPDILIIDEALSVGDNRFQLKSFNRIRQFKEQGKTIIVVSHSMNSINSFCDRALLLHEGKVIEEGDPPHVTSAFHHLQFGKGTQRRTQDSAQRETVEQKTAADSQPSPTNGRPKKGTSALPAKSTTLRPEPTGGTSPEISEEAQSLPTKDADAAQIEQDMARGYRYGNKRAVISQVCIVDPEEMKPVKQLETGKRYSFILDCECNDDIGQMHVGFLVRDIRANDLFGVDTLISPPPDGDLLKSLKKGDRRRVVLDVEMALSNGTYFLTASLAQRDETKFDMWFDAYEFHVVGTEHMYTTSCVNLQPSFGLYRVD